MIKKYLGDTTRWGRVFAIGRLRGRGTSGGLVYWMVDRRKKVTMKTARGMR